MRRRKSTRVRVRVGVRVRDKVMASWVRVAAGVGSEGKSEAEGVG